MSVIIYGGITRGNITLMWCGRGGASKVLFADCPNGGESLESEATEIEEVLGVMSPCTRKDNTLLQQRVL